MYSSSNLSHTASLWFQVGCWWADQRHSWWMASRKLWSLTPVDQKSESDAQTPAIVSLVYLWTASCLRHVGSRAHFSDRKSALHHIPRDVSSTKTASTWTHICCDNTARQLCCTLAVFCSSYSRALVHGKCKVHSVDWNSNTSLPIFSTNCSFSSCKSKKQHLGSAILHRCGMAGPSCGPFVWEGCQTDRDSIGLWIGWNS